jgi:hypothetical protein
MVFLACAQPAFSNTGNRAGREDREHAVEPGFHAARLQSLLKANPSLLPIGRLNTSAGFVKTGARGADRRDLAWGKVFLTAQRAPHSDYRFTE